MSAKKTTSNNAFYPEQTRSVVLWARRVAAPHDTGEDGLWQGWKPWPREGDAQIAGPGTRRKPHTSKSHLPKSKGPAASPVRQPTRCDPSARVSVPRPGCPSSDHNCSPPFQPRPRFGPESKGGSLPNVASRAIMTLDHLYPPFGGPQLHGAEGASCGRLQARYRR